MACHSALACAQRMNTWKESSSSAPQIVHMLVVGIPHWTILTCVEIAFRHIFQVRIFTLGGTGQLHISFQLGLSPLGCVLVAP
jgi:hypothetical protein